jgi:NAD(P)-dependent dehydrogenase (short-subunit alcohol dehydrogenase family)
MADELKRRAAIITGGNRGLGLAIGEAFVAAGADVFLCARDAAPLEEARAALQRVAAPGQRVLARSADVSKPDLARAVVEEAIAAFSQVSVLVNNAGVYGPKGAVESLASEDERDQWVRAIEINLMGSVWMASALVPHLRAQQYGKIIQLSGGGATAPLPRLSAYAASKAAAVRFAETLAEELRDDHVDVNSIAPGALNTRLLDEILAAGPEQVGEAFFAKAQQQKSAGGAPLERAAALAVFLASAASDGISGKLISALWDPWEDFPRLRDDLRKSDVYTLRRIVPAERGFDWDKKR